MVYIHTERITPWSPQSLLHGVRSNPLSFLRWKIQAFQDEKRQNMTIP